MTVQPDHDLSDLPVARSWATSVSDDLERSNRRAWIVAIIAALVALLEAVALVFLMPLKTVEPYTLLVDRQTGNIEALAPLDTQVIAPDAALTRSFLVQYVIARESFVAGSVEQDYRKVSLWSDNQVAQQYQRMMEREESAKPACLFAQWRDDPDRDKKRVDTEREPLNGSVCHDHHQS